MEGKAQPAVGGPPVLRKSGRQRNEPGDPSRLRCTGAARATDFRLALRSLPPNLVACDTNNRQFRRGLDP
jgi:hypothetical protein